jgi:hypothetical protein
MPIDTWSPADEQRYQELHERRERVTRARFALLESLARTILSGHSGPIMPSALAHAMIGNADGLRDALAPYDSGVRPVQG